MKEIPVTFTSGGQQVVGMFHVPKKKPAPAVLFLHGFTGNKAEAHRLFVVTARRLTAAGFACLRFDFRGSGDSAGEFSDMCISTELADAKAAFRFLGERREVEPHRVGVLGMSMGGMVGALLLGDEPRIRAGVLWCPVADFGALVRSNRSYMRTQNYRKNKIIDYGGWPIGAQFVDDGKRHRPVEALARSMAPILIIHGDADQTVPVAESALYTTARAREIIPGADHAFTNLAWTEQVVSCSALWLQAHLSRVATAPFAAVPGLRRRTRAG